ncbi:hypothetical protein ANCCAN_25347 [Ancylostoma caninum]|uniref:Uncharacterized protein n=1 Tax=Ancylostoma caninum TaxID=29170 RepID=A0A368F9S6_ANCCA|nr:hypothetical protein ANCCAN_25347 [Ancylostoma caninum]
MARHQPVTGSMPVIGSAFEPRRPIFLEDDVVVIDTMQPCTSGRSVEVARDEPISSTRHTEKNKRYFPHLLTFFSYRRHKMV